jgi:hypothetical protein
MKSTHDASDDARRPSTLRDVLFKDVRAGDLPGTFSRDLRNLYQFYLSDEERARLARVGRVRRTMKIILWIFKSLLLKLSPIRRLLLVTALLLFVLGRTSMNVGGVSFTPNLSLWGFLILLFTLMLELRDKLLARDEIDVARQVQLALLPTQLPSPEGWAIWSYSRPANDVGGDLIDYFDFRPGGVAVALGDVAGKGLGAALLMAKLQATFRALAPQNDSLAELGRGLNTILYRDGLENRFATLFCVRIDPGRPCLRYLNAGHNPPLLARAQRIDSLPASSQPLGILPDATYTEDSVDLEPGDLLLIYSDGLVEARGPQGNEFGLDKLRRLIPQLRGLTVERAGARLLEEADRFLAGEPPHDDLSLVLLQRTGRD